MVFFLNLVFNISEFVNFYKSIILSARTKKGDFVQNMVLNQSEFSTFTKLASKNATLDFLISFSLKGI